MTPPAGSPPPDSSNDDKPGVRGFFKRLRAKLNTGPAWLTTDIRELLPGRKIDAEILDDLETRLITADVGMAATTRILDELRRRVARKELDDVDALLRALHAAMMEILAPVQRPLVIDAGIKPLRLWEVMRRFFRLAAQIIENDHPALAEKLHRASPHWMRIPMRPTRLSRVSS